MTTLNVSLPDSLRQFVEEHVERGGFSTTSEYIRHLIREARDAEAAIRLEQLLLNGMQSGPAEPFEAAEWNALRLRVAEERAGYDIEPRHQDSDAEGRIPGQEPG